MRLEIFCTSIHATRNAELPAIAQLAPGAAPHRLAGGNPASHRGRDRDELIVAGRFQKALELLFDFRRTGALGIACRLKGRVVVLDEHAEERRCRCALSHGAAGSECRTGRKGKDGGRRQHGT